MSMQHLQGTAKDGEAGEPGSTAEFLTGALAAVTPLDGGQLERVREILGEGMSGREAAKDAHADDRDGRDAALVEIEARVQDELEQILGPTAWRAVRDRFGVGFLHSIEIGFPVPPGNEAEREAFLQRAGENQ
jgi:hypothetical protein